MGGLVGAILGAILVVGASLAGLQEFGKRPGSIVGAAVVSIRFARIVDRVLIRARRPRTSLLAGPAWHQVT